MKVAVSADSAALASTVDPRFGRALCFVIVDTSSGEYKICENQRARARSHGAGPLVAKTLADLGVSAVITGNVGPNAFRALRAAGIEVFVVYAGTVESVIARYKVGRLQKAESPTRAGHGPF